MSELPAWAQWATALAPIIYGLITVGVAIFAAVIAHRQSAIARDKLVLDLFDKRSIVFVRDSLSDLVNWVIEVAALESAILSANENDDRQAQVTEKWKAIAMVENWRADAVPLFARYMRMDHKRSER